MSTSPPPHHPRLHPAHALLLSFPIALFAFALVSDITYLSSAEIQWSNLSQWAITGALLFGGPVVVWGVIDWLHNRRSVLERRALIYLGLVAAMWVLGLFNAFKHSQDGWFSVGTAGVLLSVLCTGLALGAGWIAHSTAFSGERK